MSWSSNNLLYGGTIDQLPEDSDSIVCVPISYIKIANAKMIELNYQKELNTQYKHIISNDSIIIENYKIELTNKNNTYKKQTKELKKQRNISAGVGIGSLLLLLISLL